jgi:FkbM family methyltransferase
MRVSCRSYIEWELYFFGTYEPRVADALQRHVPSGAIALDVGANIGVHTLALAGLAGDAGRVVAFEPQPDLADRLVANVALNALSNVTVERAAVLERAGTVDLYTPSGPNTGMASLIPREGWRRLDVRGCTLDEEAERLALRRVDFIKVDVEGHEAAVLAGGKRVLAQWKPKLLFEYVDWAWEAAGNDLAATLIMLRDLGYETFIDLDRRRTFVRSNPVRAANILALPRHPSS